MMDDISNSTSNEESSESLGQSEERLEPIILGREFPDKPIEPNETDKGKKFITSAVFFVAAAYFLFDWEIDFIVKLIVVLVIHELGHYFAMRAFDYKDLKIFFIPLVGAMASGKKLRISQKQDVIISFAGPIPGMIIGTILYAVGVYTDQEFLDSFAMMFIFINGFNLLPVYPLDGGRALKTLFFNSNLMIGAVFTVLSIVCLATLSFYTSSYFLLVLPAFLAIQLVSQFRMSKLKKMLEEKGFETDKSFEQLSNKEYWLAREEIGRHVPAFSNHIKQGEYQMAQIEYKILSYLKGLFVSQPTKDLSGLGKFVMVVIWALAFVVPIGGLVVVAIGTAAY